VAAAIEELRRDEPEAWLLFDGDKGPSHALWANLAAGFADDLPLEVSVGVVDDLRGPVGRAARVAGTSPYERPACSPPATITPQGGGLGWALPASSCRRQCPGI
jgi:hypothetical protein